jgi:biotin carboxyl carrier protein
MKYEVTIAGEQQLIDIKPESEGAYRIQLGEGAPVIVEAHWLDGQQLVLRKEGRSYWAGCQVGKEEIEVFLRGNRYLAEVIDPRRKALRIGEGAAGNRVTTKMPGRIVKVCTEVGQSVSKGDVLVVVEAMKMENPLKSPRDGVVSSIEVNEGDLVEGKTTLVTLE